MEIRWDEDGWHFEEMDSLVLDLLGQLPGCALTEDEAAEARIFSSPTAGADAQEDEDWRENVMPELRELFQSHVDTVRGDLAHLKTEGETSSLHIPVANALAWIHTLNQARLALGAKHGVTEDDIEARRKVRGNAKAYALLQIDFYGMLLGLILSRTEL